LPTHIQCEGALFSQRGPQDIIVLGPQGAPYLYNFGPHFHMHRLESGSGIDSTGQYKFGTDRDLDSYVFYALKNEQLKIHADCCQCHSTGILFKLKW